MFRGLRMLSRWEERDPSLPLSWKTPDHFPKDRGSQREQARGAHKEFSVAAYCEGLLAVQRPCLSALATVLHKFPELW